MRRVQRRNDGPGLIPAAVVHKQDTAVCADAVFVPQPRKLFGEPLCGFRQHLLLIVAGDDNIQRFHKTGIPPLVRAGPAGMDGPGG